ncbi:hypothetical protein LCGC14_1267510 [marine sediment metagenome]|uniref:Coenzyme Q-binding protein COQ10 START domain-containing protein n=1 Tax=marine sediment metagenome TaxID=412755 RepID=A0A0F9KZ29_9ZZZZ
MPRFEEEIIIKASADAVYDLIADSRNLQEMLPGFEIKILETGEDYRICDCRLKTEKETFKWTHRENFDPELLSIDYALVEGDWDHFNTWWKIIPAQEECELIFQSEMAPKNNGIMTYLTWPFFKKKMNRLCLGMIQSVKDRLELSYGQSS